MAVSGSTAGTAPFGGAIEAGKNDRVETNAEGDELTLATDFFELLDRPLVDLGRAIGEHVGGQKLAGEGSGLRGERLFRGSDFTRDGAGRIFAGVDGKERGAGDAIEQIDETLFGRLRYGVDFPGFALDGEQYGGARKIAIPDVVVDALKMPEALAGFGVQGDEAVGKEIVADTICAVKIEGSGACGDVDDAAVGVDGHAGPVVGGAGVFPGVLGPGVVSKFAGLRNGAEGPAEFAGARVKSADVAWRRWERLGVAAADDEEIVVDDRRAGERDEGLGVVAAEIFAEIDAAVLAECLDGFAGGSVQRVNEVHYADEDSLAGGVGVGPEGEAAVRLRAVDDGIEFPEQLAGGGFKGENLLSGSDSVKDAVDDDGAGLQAAGFLCVERPGYF